MKRILITLSVVAAVLLAPAGAGADPVPRWHGGPHGWCDVWILRPLPQEPVQRWDVVPACKHLRRSPRGIPPR